MTIKDLRAIPFVASWTMIKQNVAGFYGLGTALEQIKHEGKFEKFKELYKKSLFLRTLIDNSEMTLCRWPHMWLIILNMVSSEKK